MTAADQRGDLRTDGGEWSQFLWGKCAVEDRAGGIHREKENDASRPPRQWSRANRDGDLTRIIRHDWSAEPPGTRRHQATLVIVT